MSFEYDLYLDQHRSGVMKAFYWIEENIPEWLEGRDIEIENIVRNHDTSKNEQDEYDAYDAYFYGGNRSYEVVRDFNKAFLLHLHRNPHHWQYWVLIQDDPDHEEIVFDMPREYVIEMICDWWSFSWNSGKLDEIFTWYDEHKNYIKLGKQTRKTVESILTEIKNKLEVSDDNN